MQTTRHLARALTRTHAHLPISSTRALTISSRTSFKAETDAVSPQTTSETRQHPNVDEHRKSQTERPLNPHLTNTTSAIHNEKDVPKVGFDNAPPEFLSKVDEGYAPKDKVPENTERMTGGTQSGHGSGGSGNNVSDTSSSTAAATAPTTDGGWGVGEMEGAEFKIEPIKRSGEDVLTMRARLLYQSRKRGTLESDLLLSTFASQHLGTMTRPQLEEYDKFLDENDWDIYYWVTQSEAGGSPTSLEYAEGSVSNTSSPASTDTDTSYKAPSDPRREAETDEWRQGAPRSGEWAQTVGTFKPAFRPVPQRWKGSEVLGMLRRHVRERSAGGVLEDVEGDGEDA